MWSKLLALADLLPRLLDWLERLIKKVKHEERERRHEEIDRDPAGEFTDKFRGMRDDQQPPVPGDHTSAEPDPDRCGRDHTDRQ